jgi:hypothetical protein
MIIMRLLQNLFIIWCAFGMQILDHEDNEMMRPMKIVR